MGKKREGSIIASARDLDAGTITWVVAGAGPDGGPGTLVLDLTKVHPDVVTAAAYHGFVQRVGDAAALSRDTTTGKPASPANKLAAMAEVVAHYASGTAEWAMGRKAGGGAGPQSGVTLAAVAYVQGMDVATMRTRVDALAAKRGIEPAALLRELAKAPAVMRRIAEIKAAKAPANGDDMLAELAGEPEEEPDTD